MVSFLQDLEEIIRYYIHVCVSHEHYITLSVLYGYKVLLQIMALIFAMSIRKVHIKGLNDAVYVVAAIYVTSIVTAVVVVSTYTLTEFIPLYSALPFSLAPQLSWDWYSYLQ